MKARQISMPGGRRHRNRAPATAPNLRQLVSKCCFVGNTRQAAQTAHALADVNHLWPVGNELETPVPPLSHKQFPHWLRIAFTGVARATRGVPHSQARLQPACNFPARRGGEIWASVSSSCWSPSSAADGVDVRGDVRKEREHYGREGVRQNQASEPRRQPRARRPWESQGQGLRAASRRLEPRYKSEGCFLHLTSHISNGRCCGDARIAGIAWCHFRGSRLGHSCRRESGSCLLCGYLAVSCWRR